MAELRCPRCGKASKGVCRACYLTGHPFTVDKKKYRLCGCGLAFFKGRWYDDPERLHQEVAKRSVRPPSGVKVKGMRVRHKSESGQSVYVAEVTATYKGKDFRETVSWEVRPETVKCEACRRQGSGYFEAVLQVREKGYEPDLDELMVAKAEAVRGGADYYLTSLDYARETVRNLMDAGFLVKESSKLYGQRDGRDVYRHWFSIKRPPYTAGDFIMAKGHPARVVELARTLKLFDLDTGKVKSGSLNQYADAKVIAKGSDVKRAQVTEVRPDGIQVMDSQDYDTHNLPLKKGLTQGQEVEYVRIAGKMYLL